jgi:hypothetical protein
VYQSSAASGVEWHLFGGEGGIRTHGTLRYA